MEAQIFTPDSKRLVFRRSAITHDGKRYDPDYRLMLCDLENDGELSVLSDEMGATGPSVSPDGKCMYYFVGEKLDKGERVSLKRVNLDGTDRKTLHVIDGILPGTNYYPNFLYPLSTISSDGKRIAISCFLGDGETENMPYGLLVYDIEKGTVDMILEGMTWLNMHPQYSRSLNPEASHDIMIQENHGSEYDIKGHCLPGKLVGGDGADIHLIRDDGTNFRSMPCGRDSNREYCQGHQCWRGRSESAIIGTSVPRRPGQDSKLELIETYALPDQGHLGMYTQGAWRINLSKNYERPRFSHFATDIAGIRIISDSPIRGRWLLHMADLPKEKGESPENWQFLLNTRSSTDGHPHPFFSPDGSMGFFNSDESGILRPYMIRGI